MFCNIHYRSPSHPWLHLLQGIYIFFAVMNVTDFARVLWLTGNCRKDIDFSVDFISYNFVKPPCHFQPSLSGVFWFSYREPRHLFKKPAWLSPFQFVSILFLFLA